MERSKSTFEGCLNSGFLNSKFIQIQRNYATLQHEREARAVLHGVGAAVLAATAQQQPQQQPPPPPPPPTPTPPTPPTPPTTPTTPTPNHSLSSNSLKQKLSRNIEKEKKQEAQNSGLFLGQSSIVTTDNRVNDSKTDLIDNAPIVCVSEFKKLVQATGGLNRTGQAFRLSIPKESWYSNNFLI